MNAHCFGSREWELWKKNQLNGSNPQLLTELIGSFIAEFEKTVIGYPSVSPFIGLPISKLSTRSAPFAKLAFPLASGFFQTPDMLLEGKRLVHFTSFEVAQEILGSGLIRLYTPNFGNDPHEVSLAANLCNSGKEADRKGISELFTISFTEENAIDELTMWKRYGRDGDGVALVFEMINPIEKWHDWYYGGITYLESEQKTRVLSQFEDIQGKLGVLKDKFCNQGLVFEVELLAAFAFYKSNLFHPENELRLLFRNKLEGDKDCFTGHWQDDHMNPKKKCGIRTYHTINKRLESAYYCTYPVYWHLHNLNPEEYWYYSKGPQLRIKEVVFGHNHDQKRVDQMKAWHDAILPKLVSKEWVSEYSVKFVPSPIRKYVE